MPFAGHHEDQLLIYQTKGCFRFVVRVPKRRSVCQSPHQQELGGTMSQGFDRSRQWFRTLVMCRIVGCVVLTLLIFSSILMQDTASAHAFNTLSVKGASHTHAPPPSHRKDFLKKQEGAWFQLSHFGKQHPRPDARIKARK